MIIRPAVIEDADALCTLLAQMDYPVRREMISGKLFTLPSDPREEIWVAEDTTSVLGLISMSFIPQIALEGDFARINYLCVNKTTRSRGIGKALEKYCVARAQKHGCDRIELHCHLRRKDAHRFYLRQGYTESPKYFVKSLR